MSWRGLCVGGRHLLFHRFFLSGRLRLHLVRNSISKRPSGQAPLIRSHSRLGFCCRVSCFNSAVLGRRLLVLYTVAYVEEWFWSLSPRGAVYLVRQVQNTATVFIIPSLLRLHVCSLLRSVSLCLGESWFLPFAVSPTWHPA